MRKRDLKNVGLMEWLSIANLKQLTKGGKMKKSFLSLVLSFIFLWQFFGPSYADEDVKAQFPKGKVWGYVFGDYFYSLKSSDPSKKSFNAFQLRRAYLGYDYQFSEKVSSQFLLEGDQKELTSGGKFGMFIKTAYLEMKDLIPQSDVQIGLSSTPTWSTHSEKIWAYRSIEKTIMDLRKLGAASDFGLGLKGNFDKSGILSYHFMVGNGTGQKPEDNKYKKLYGYFIVKPIKQIDVEFYGDYEGVPSEKGSDLDKDIHTLKIFASYQNLDLTFGIEAFQQTRKNARTSDTGKSFDVIPSGISIFLHGTLIKEKLRAYARYDIYDPDKEKDDASEHLYIAGLDYLMNKNIHFMPNIMVNDYKGKDQEYDKKDCDINARLTFYYIFK